MGMELRLFSNPKLIGTRIPLSFTFPKQIIKSSSNSLTKKTHRFISTLSTTAAAGDLSATNRFIKKFVETSPKSIALNALSDIISPHAPQPRLHSIALTLYSRITEASWFTWNSRLVADLVAFLDKHGQYIDSETLTSDTISKLGFQERKLVTFYCHLIECQSKHGSEKGFDKSYACLLKLLHNSSSVYVKRRAYESMVSGLCFMDRPQEAESLVKEMKATGITPSAFEYRSIVYAYGTLGLFEDMNRNLAQMEKDGIALDTVCSNMVLSSYGAHNKLADMVLWLQRMKTSSIPSSVRTYNSVLNSCPKIMSMLRDKSSNLSLSTEDLIQALDGDEALLIEELDGSSVLKEIMVWDAVELKLDLHGAHIGAAYLIMLQWMKEMQLKFVDGKTLIPAEVTVICGSGNHSSVRGESPLKALIKEMMVRMGSPLRIDRKNNGCLVAKGKTVRDWLCLR